MTMPIHGRPESSAPANALPALVATHFEGHPFVRAGQPVVVAVSGGPDSVALLDLLAGLARRGRLAVVVAHLDHGLRGEVSAEDARFVAGLAAQYGFPFHGGREDVAELARREKRSIEDAARVARRRFLESAAVETGAAATALGHTRDDQAETLLLNLVRGSGPRGLAAMPEYGPGRITRPLLRASRAQVEAHLRAHGLAWRTDATNLDTGFTRNRIRHELMPLLRDRFNPAIAEALARQADLFGEIDQLLSALAEGLLADPALAERGGDSVRIDVARLAGQPPALQRALLRRAAQKLAGSLTDWGRTHLDAVLELARRTEPGHLDLPGGIVADVEGGGLRLGRAAGGRQPGGAADGATDEPPAPVRLPVVHGTEAAWGTGWIRVILLGPRTDAERVAVAGGAPSGATASPGGLRRGAAVPPDGTRSVWFDAAELGTELLIRAPRPGDRLRPFGGGGGRLISDILSERRVPRAARAAAPLVLREPPGGNATPEAEVVWLPGLCRSNAAPVTGGTGAVVCLEWFGPPPGVWPGACPAAGRNIS